MKKHTGNVLLLMQEKKEGGCTCICICFAAAAAAKSLQSCPTLCDPTDGSPLGSPVPGILQTRTPEWVAISFSNAWKWKVKVKSLSRVQLLVTPWTAAYQAPSSMGFSRQEYWSVWLTSFPEILKPNHKSNVWFLKYDTSVTRVRQRMEGSFSCLLLMIFWVR